MVTIRVGPKLKFRGNVALCIRLVNELQDRRRDRKKTIRRWLKDHSKRFFEA